ncbi:MAG TPA: hypothetical protein VGI75_15035 [Pirellulales bacterium]
MGEKFPGWLRYRLSNPNLIAETSTVLEDRGVKLVACYTLAVGLALVATASSLRAKTIEELPAPTGMPSNESDRGASDASLDWSDNPDNSAHFQDNSTHFDVGDQHQFLDHDPNQIGPPAYPYSSGYWWRNGCWYGDFDFVVWNRTQPLSRVLGVDASPAGILFRDRLNKHGSQLPLEPGGRATIGYLLNRDIDNRDHSIEVTYLGFNNWEGVDSLKSTAGQSLFVREDLSFPGFNGADTYATTYRSDLQSFEIDYRLRNRPGRDRMIMGPDGFWSRQLAPGFTQSLLVGIRGISEQENFHWTAMRNATALSDFGGDDVINTKNTLLGVQIGGDLMNIHDHWYWGLKGDTGVYCNFSDGFQTLHGLDPNSTTGPTSEFIQAHATGQTAAYFGELTFLLGYNVSDHLFIHAGWDMSLLGGIAMAPDNVSFTTYLSDARPFLNTGSVIFYTGLSLGLDCYW